MENPVDDKRYSVEGVHKMLNESNMRSYETYDKVVAIIFGSFLMTCSCFGVTLNLIALAFFQKGATNFKSKVVFMAATCVDILICCLCPFAAAPLLLERSPLAFSQDLFCQVWGYCWSFASRYSAYIVSIASLVRVHLMYYPSVVTVTKMKNALFVGAALLLFIELLPFFFKERFLYLEELGACTPAGFFFENMAPFTVRGLFSSYIPALTYLLPIPICLSCYILSCAKLWHCPPVNAQRVGSRKRRFRLQATLTISSFMSAYLLLQVPLPVYAVFVMTKIFSGSTVLDAVVSDPWWFSLYMPHVLYIVSVSLNAALNPAIYYWRLQDFRRFVKDFVLRNSYADLKKSFDTPKFSLLLENVREWNLEMLRVERRSTLLEENEWQTAKELKSDTISEEQDWKTAGEESFASLP